MIARHDTWEYLAGLTPQGDWTQLDFATGDWKEGPAGFGYAGSDDVTDLPTMKDNFTVVYLRHEFDIDPADEVAVLGRQIDHLAGPIHLVGHSYGGAVAFKMASSDAYASRIRSLTLIEPVLPTLLRDNPAERRLHDLFADMGTRIHVDLWNGMYMEALDRFLDYWSGSGPREALSGEARMRLIQTIEKVPFDFTGILGEVNVASAAAALRVPTLLVSGGLSPYMTQRIVARLATLIPGSEIRHLTAAGHMLPITHAKAINPDIVRHIELAEDFAKVLLATPPGAAAASRGKPGHLRPVSGGAVLRQGG